MESNFQSEIDQIAAPVAENELPVSLEEHNSNHQSDIQPLSDNEKDELSIGGHSPLELESPTTIIQPEPVQDLPLNQEDIPRTPASPVWITNDNRNEIEAPVIEQEIIIPTPIIEDLPLQANESNSEVFNKELFVEDHVEDDPEDAPTSPVWITDDRKEVEAPILNQTPEIIVPTPMMEDESPNHLELPLLINEYDSTSELFEERIVDQVERKQIEASKILLLEYQPILLLEWKESSIVSDDAKMEQEIQSETNKEEEGDPNEKLYQNSLELVPQDNIGICSSIEPLNECEKKEETRLSDQVEPEMKIEPEIKVMEEKIVEEVAEMQLDAVTLDSLSIGRSDTKEEKKEEKEESCEKLAVKALETVFDEKKGKNKYIFEFGGK